MSSFDHPRRRVASPVLVHIADSAVRRLRTGAARPQLVFGGARSIAADRRNLMTVGCQSSSEIMKFRRRRFATGSSPTTKRFDSTSSGLAMQTTSRVISAQRHAKKICAPTLEATQRVVPMSTGSRIRSSLRSCANDRTEDCSAVIRTTSGSGRLLLPGKGYWLVRRHASRPDEAVSCGSQTVHCAVRTCPLWHNRSILLSPTSRVLERSDDGMEAQGAALRRQFYNGRQFVDASASKSSAALGVRFTGVLR